jgi:inner membrane protein
MDNLCHSLVGAALATTGLKQRTRYATAALVIGANFPDIDAPAAFLSYGLSLRRGITHGIPALIVLPFALTGILLLWARIRRTREDVVPKQLLLLSALAMVTHPVLDWMNSYGMRWLMPFDGTWTYGDSLFIIDPWLLLLLGAAWLLRRAWLARLLVGIAAVYVVTMVGLTRVGRAVASGDLGLTAPGPRLLVTAPFLRSWRRMVVVDRGTAYRFGEIDWLPRPRLVLSGDSLPKRLELLDGVSRTPALESLLSWARFPFVRPDGPLLLVDDARYGRRGRSFAGVAVSRAALTSESTTPEPRSPMITPREIVVGTWIQALSPILRPTNTRIAATAGLRYWNLSMAPASTK